jgi:hypothetical protein
MPPLVWGSADMIASASPDTPWLWQGYLARGAVTLLTSQWKAGKTTLASVLLARLKTGGALAGRSLAQGRALVISEENADHWARRHRHLDFADHVGWFFRPFRGRPRPSDWHAFIDGIASLHPRYEFSLVIIDPLAAFLPGSENSSSAVLEALMPLQRLAALGVAILINHHPNKGDPPVGQAARGSGALAGFADILIEMRLMPKADSADRRRRLWASSRYPETPGELIIEWSLDGTDYLARGTFLQEEFLRRWLPIHNLLAEAPRKLTRAEIRHNWPADDLPDRLSLRRWLEHAVENQLLKKDGLGRRSNPFRYWLPEREESWKNDPIARLFMPELTDPGPSLDP